MQSLYREVVQQDTALAEETSWLFHNLKYMPIIVTMITEDFSLT